jgi:hypothetical protein
VSVPRTIEAVWWTFEEERHKAGKDGERMRERERRED